MAARPSALDLYQHVGVIGKGSFGTVSKIMRKSDRRILVWKELNYGHMREKEKQLVVSEVNILRELRHPFIVRYYDRIIDKSSTKIYIVMELCEGGDLGAMIKRCRREGTTIDEALIWKCFAQIVLALKDCHRHKESSGALKPILHRDLKPGNIFLDRDRNIKIGDFGLAKELTSQSKFAETNVGTPFYMSPEMINEMKYNEKSDIWALGCLLYELAALVPPFEASNHLSLAMKINDGRFRRIPSRYSEDLHRAIRWMLNKDQAKRPTVEDLERHPKIRSASRDSALIVREYQLNQTYASKLRELKTKEEELRKREAAIAETEKRLADMEAKLRKGILPAKDTVTAKTLDDASNRRASGADIAPPAPPVRRTVSENVPPPAAPVKRTTSARAVMAACGAGDLGAPTVDKYRLRKGATSAWD